MAVYASYLYHRFEHILARANLLILSWAGLRPPTLLLRWDCQRRWKICSYFEHTYFSSRRFRICYFVSTWEAPILAACHHQTI